MSCGVNDLLARDRKLRFMTRFPPRETEYLQIEGPTRVSLPIFDSIFFSASYQYIPTEVCFSCLSVAIHLDLSFMAIIYSLVIISLELVLCISIYSFLQPTSDSQNKQLHHTLTYTKLRITPTVITRIIA